MPQHSLGCTHWSECRHTSWGVLTVVYATISTAWGVLTGVYATVYIYIYTSWGVLTGVYSDVSSHVGGVTAVPGAVDAQQPGMLAAQLLVHGPFVHARCLLRR